MSEQKLVSPLLDGFTLGNAMSNHDGVRCYPAMKENSDEKYIVKVVSIPASQVQLDALLLTGAYKDPADAMDYFKEVADGIEKETRLLKKLSKLEGFLGYEGIQIVPMEKGKLGYEVYLLSSYKRSLDRYMRRHLLTHLEAVNLALDLCQALAVCRRSGHIYVDVKPENIFISKGKEYRIGDLGFVALDSLAFTSLPGRYSSRYSPPEVRDDLMPLNKTVDTYGVGMVLYKVFNDGNLPAIPKDSTEPFPAPANADYELAEIILKAISPIVSERWQTPAEMGQAIIGYMQRNKVNNTPLAPPRAILEDVEPISFTPKKAETKIEEAVPVQALEDATETILSEPEESAPNAEPEALSDSDTQNTEIDNLECTQTVIPSPVLQEESEPAIAENTPAPESTEQTPDIPPEPVLELDEDEEDFLKLLSEELEESTDDQEYPQEELMPEENIMPEKPSRKKGWIIAIVLLLVLALLGAGGYYLYENYYLQKIDALTIEGSQNELTVSIDTDMDLSKLSVRCTDTYGNATVLPAADGQVVFSELLPDSLYRIELEVSGPHKLIGKTAEIFTTDALTNIVSITAITGPEDGSAIINFTVDGSDPEEWLISCSAEGEEVITQSFTGHSVTVKGMTVGKKYTLTLGSTDGTDVLGNNTQDFTATRLVMAEELTISASENGTMTARWKQPQDVVIESWTARCYSDNGHEQITEVTGNEVVFTDIRSDEAYTVEVTASGMTQPTRVSITANPITISNFTVSEDTAGQLNIAWEHSGNVPEGGWLLMYKLDGSETPNVIKTEASKASISPRIHGATYHFELQAADATTLFANTYHHTCSNVGTFDAHGVASENVSPYLLKTPEGEWLTETVSEDDFVNSFAPGDPISMVLRVNIGFNLPHDEMNILFVIRDGNGNVLSEYVAEDTMDWYDIWFDGDYHDAELDLPKVPTAPGEYTVNLYFNHSFVTTATFSIAE